MSDLSNLRESKVRAQSGEAVVRQGRLSGGSEGESWSFC